MERLIDTYHAPLDPAVPLICFDEAGKELQAQVQGVLPMAPGHPRREDPEYVRHGSANLFMVYAPHLGWRHVPVTARRTGADWAFAMRDLVDVHFPAAERIVVVLDNLNTHRLSSLYLTFPAPEAHRIARKLDLRFTPVHGSWLNMAEGELSVLSRQCLNRRVPDQATLEREVAAWAAARNEVGAPGMWRFTVNQARSRLTSLYPIPTCATSS